MSSLTVSPFPAPTTSTWVVPGSKSMTNRALVLAALVDGSTTCKGVLHSDDTRHMTNALRKMGVEIEVQGPTTVVVRGGRSRLRAPPAGESLFIGNSGTTVRFLAAFAALVPGTVTFTGDEHMAKRPISDLVDALTALGVEVECASGCPPLTVHGRGFPAGSVAIPGTKSSQYFSALLLSAGLAAGPVSISVVGELVSRPYVRMTIQMVQDFGGQIEETSEGGFRVQPVPGGSYACQGGVCEIEPDASSASYPFAVAAATRSTIRVPSLNARSLQGDYAFVDILAQMGCGVTKHADWTEVSGPPQGQPLKGLDVDMHHISDTVMTLAALAPLCAGPTTIRNVANIRIKETDRLVAIVNELRRLGQGVEHGEDWLTITPKLPVRPAEVECYADHRIAMAFAVLGTAVPGVTITDPGCTAKTYPAFFADLATQRRRSCWGVLVHSNSPNAPSAAAAAAGEAGEAADGGRNPIEEARKFTARIRAFMVSGESELAFPPSLDSEDRKVIHDICYELELGCKSRGPKKNGRFITVYRMEAPELERLQQQKARSAAAKRQKTAAAGTA
jgi:3-phosphoshikimate 1-carboxyvinyltransferase|eukprot:COSAG01_NODE_606_length_14864_cov_190.098327_11_plen_562_part_00